MKKILKAFMVLALPLTFFSCGGDDDKDNNPESPSADVSTISVEVERDIAQVDEEYSEEILLDLSGNPLSAAGLALLNGKKNGDVAEYFSQSTIDSSRSAVDDRGLIDFKAILTGVSSSEIRAQITGTAPGSACTILITAAIPGNLTEIGKAQILLVRNIVVGQYEAISADTSAFKSKTIPAAEEMAGKVLSFEDDDDDDGPVTVYYKFSSAGNVITEYKKNEWLDSPAPSGTSYNYDEKTGEITEIIYDSGDEEEETGFSGSDMDTIKKSFAGKDFLMKYNGQYYSYSDLKLSRVRGSAFDSTFAYSNTVNIDSQIPLSETSSVTLKTTGNIVLKLTTSIDKTFSFALKTEIKSSMSDGDKSRLEAALAEYKEAFSQYEGFEAEDEESFSVDSMLISQTSLSEMVGVYINDGGIFHLTGKEYSYGSEDDDSDGDTEVFVRHFEDSVLLYDGSNVYMAESLSLSDELLD
ncbi:MAG: hypothetical protein IJ727_07630 [Treponema sp.]|nr:hypothetical protein [Treponema sp.]